MVIVFGVVIIMNISIYYFCWGGFCSASRCCAASSSIYPLIWSIVMFIGAFLSTYFGSLLLTVGYDLEKYLDNAIREVASSFVPDNSLIFPTIYLGPYTHNLVNEKFDLTWHVLPNNLILFEKLNIASISLPLVEILNLEDSFNFKMLGLLFNSKFLEIYDTYTIPNDMILLLNEAITTLQDKSQICQDLYDLQTTKNYTQQIEEIKELIDPPGTDTKKQMALQSLRALEQRLLSANENIFLNVKRLQDGIPLELNTSANSLTASIKSVIKSNGSILSNGIPLIYDLINSVSIDQILHYYHAICNPIKYDIPYFASCLSLAAHTLFPGFIILVLVMWFHRRDQLPRNFAKKVFKYGTEASSYDESTESGRTIIRNRHNVDSSSESSSNARFMGESSTSEKSPIKDTNRRRRKKVSSSSSSDTSETMSDSEEPPPTANSMEL